MGFLVSNWWVWVLCVIGSTLVCAAILLIAQKTMAETTPLEKLALFFGLIAILGAYLLLAVGGYLSYRMLALPHIAAKLPETSCLLILGAAWPFLMKKLFAKEQTGFLKECLTAWGLLLLLYLLGKTWF